jgi:ATP-dependent Clp protease ATP-binding subunit ClpA
LKRTIQKEVETALGRQLLEGKIRDGQTVLADYRPGDDHLAFSVKGS